MFEMCQKKEFWIYAALTRENIVEKSVWGLISKVREILSPHKGWSICCLLAGDKVNDAAESLAPFVDRVYALSDSSLKEENHMRYSIAMVPLIKREKPEVILFGVSVFNSILAAALGMHLKTGVIAHSIDININSEGNIVGAIPAFGGSFIGDIMCPDARPQIIGVRAVGVFPEELPHRGEIVYASCETAKASDDYSFICETLSARSNGKSIENADFIICGGHGVGSLENWELLEEVAGMLGAEVASTRPPVDEGWVKGEERMIGISGKYVAPKVYIGVGVSGTSHHLCGMRDSKVVININSDDNALSMHNSDYIVKCDARDILLALRSVIVE